MATNEETIEGKIDVPEAHYKVRLNEEEKQQILQEFENTEDPLNGEIKNIGYIKSINNKRNKR